MREIPFGTDGDFSEGRFVAVVNGALANGLGNLVSRCLGLLAKHAASAYPASAATAPADHPLRQAAAEAVAGAEAAYSCLAMHEALAAAQTLVERYSRQPQGLQLRTCAPASNAKLLLIIGTSQSGDAQTIAAHVTKISTRCALTSNHCSACWPGSCTFVTIHEAGAWCCPV